MKARRLTKEEFKRTDELFSLAFNYRLEDEEEEKEQEENSEKYERTEYKYGAFDDEGNMTSCISVPVYDFNFDGNTYKMGGIGGVSTPPQYRRGGGIRACFNVALREMYDEGFDFSYLYPFSTAYYRKFGYEIACERQQYKISLDRIPDFETAGKCYLLEEKTKEQAAADIKAVMENWEKKYNLMVVSSPAETKWIEESNPYKSLEYVFVYRNAENKPTAFMRLYTDITPGNRHLEARQLMYTDTEGLKAMFKIMKTYAADFGKVWMLIPKDTNLELLLPEWSFGAISRETFIHGMVRVINVINVLKGAKYRGSGALNIKLSDSQIEENNGTFRVEFENGSAVKVEKLDGEAVGESVTMGINNFSRFITGIRGGEALEMLEGIELNCSMESFDRVFYAKPCYICEYF